MRKGLSRSRLLLARSALLIAFSAPSLDPESLGIERHADSKHFTGLAAMTINASFTRAVQIESRRRVEALVTATALATVASQTL